MKNKIIYVAPNGLVLTFHTTQDLVVKSSMLCFYDDKTGSKRQLPIDRCQVEEVV